MKIGVQSIVVGALVAILYLAGCLLYVQHNEIASYKERNEALVELNEHNEKVRQEREDIQSRLDDLSASVVRAHKDNQTFNKQMEWRIREEIKDDKFKAWYNTPIDPTAIRLLREAGDKAGIVVHTDSQGNNGGE